MALFNTKKYEHKKAVVGKEVGAQTKLTNYEYGRQKAKKIASGKEGLKKRIAKKMRNEKVREVVKEAKRMTYERD